MKLLVKTLSTTELAEYIGEFARHPALTSYAQAALIFPSSRSMAAAHMDIDELRLAVQYHKSRHDVDHFVTGGLPYQESPANFRLGNLSVRNTPLDSALALRGATYAFAIVDLTADPDYRALRNSFLSSQQRFADHPSVGTIVNWDRGPRAAE